VKKPLLLLMAEGVGERAFGLNPYLSIIPTNRDESEGGLWGLSACALPAAARATSSGGVEVAIRAWF
jgi:hypothetical protein